MIILCDCDGPLADFERHFHNEWIKRYPHEFSVNPEDRIHFDINDDYPRYLQDKVWGLIEEPGFFLDIPLTKNADLVVEKLLSLDHDVRICTSPLTISTTCASEKMLWVNKYFGKEMVRRTIITKDKTYVRGNILIDDRPDFKYQSLVPNWEHIIFNAPYNKHVNNKKRLDWSNYLEVIEEVNTRYHNFATE